MKIKKIIPAILIALISLSINANASLSVHPLMIIDTVIVGQNDIIELHITNLGPSNILTYQLSATETWIDFSSNYGDIKVSDTVQIKIIIDITKLGQGNHKADILVGDPHHGPIIIPIDIYINSFTDVNEKEVIDNIKINAYPNPFNSNTEINYILPLNQNVEINILDLKGSLVKTLLNGLQMEGSYSINLDGSDLAPGTYLLTLTTETFSTVRILILNK